MRQGLARRRKEGVQFLERTKSSKGKLLMARIQEVLTACRAEENRLMERRSRQTDASVATFKASFWASTVGGIAALVGFFAMVERLIRTFSRMRQADARRADELEEQVQQRTAELQESYREMESFSYSVSHDLRAPLRSIAAFANILQEELADKVDAEQQGLLGRIVQNSGRMSELIDALLQLSRVARNDTRMVLVPLSEFAGDIIAELRGVTPSVIIEPDLKAFGDPSLLRNLLRNLFQNSVKYAAPTRAMSIQFGAKTLDGQTVFFVEDNGTGFDPAQADRVFEPFLRLHTAPEYPGSGIGLATCRKIVRRHGGRIWAESSVGVGTTIFFTLNVKRAPASEEYNHTHSKEA